MRYSSFVPAVSAFCLFVQLGGALAQSQAPASAPVPMEAAIPPQATAEVVPFIDAHVHLNDEAIQIALMERFGATRAVVFWGRNSDNEAIAAAAQRTPDRFIPFASISPERRAYRKSWDGQDSNVLTTLDQLLSTGRFKGIGEISAAHFPSPGFPEADYDPSGPIMRGVLELARKHALPVMVHVEITRMRELSLLLDAYPDVPVIWAHGGYTPLFLARRMLERHPNLHYELSARTWPSHPRAPDYTILRDGKSVWPEWLQLIEAKPERFLIGTDASQRSLNSDAMKFASVQSFLLQLSPAAREKVASQNLLRLVEPAR
ncbi:amidohydrolase family protein [Bosea sp. BH3]|uniref:amidohydrolase family protein n=1 Tax=Bosea sp. BH3 TaxID=2871701 RepID=UPI0021CB487A|nr:TatD family hydrolase [Bosea sp. BH3]MCU4182317.1 amidohydrolase family protein [Bosea sp. BH3]